MLTFEWNHAYAARLNRRGDGEPAMPELPELRTCAARMVGELSAGKLPFLDMPFHEDLVARIEALLPRLNAFRHMVVLGIGGSALGTKALQKAFFPQQDRFGHKGPWLWVLDNVDTASLEAVLNDLPPEDTLVVPVSKSGGTIETLAQYFIVRQWLETSLPDNWREHLIMVTDAASGYLRTEAEQLGLTSLPVPDSLGGRYSVLCAVGILPAAFMGLDWKAFLDGARSVNQELVEHPGSPSVLERHPAWKLAKWSHTLDERDYDQLIFFSYIPSWASFGQWFGQLWAESLGKDGKGTMPLPAVGVTDQHSLQQMFLDGPKNKGCIQIYCQNLPEGPAFPKNIPDQWRWLRGKHFGELLQAETLGAAAALAHNNVPLVRIRADQADERTAGELMGLLMTTTVLTGLLLDINPLDQPAVELGKRLACTRLGSDSYPDEAILLQEFLNRALN